MDGWIPLLLLWLCSTSASFAADDPSVIKNVVGSANPSPSSGIRDLGAAALLSSLRHLSSSIVWSVPCVLSASLRVACSPRALQSFPASARQ